MANPGVPTPSASDPDADPVATADHPRIGDHRVTDLAALLGAVVWTGLLVGRTTDAITFGLVDLFVALAVLVFVPLGLSVLPRATGGGLGGTYRLVTMAQGPAALGVVLALARPVGTGASVVLALPWLAVTGALASVGAKRLLARGLRPLHDLAIDAALLYLPVGAIALVLHRAGISLPFEPIIVLLTVVHYHYAGFVLPLVAGLAGLRLTDGERFGTDLAGRVGALATVIIVVNLALIAVGITFSPIVEVVAVALFTLAVAGFAALVLLKVVPTMPRGPGALLTVACLSLFLTMALAMAYGYSAFPATGRLISIGEMIRAHGTLNAAGFALPALLALRWLDRTA
jgi:hypothetical protein